MKILALLADGFEETEFVVPFDLWKRGGVEVITASISNNIEVTGAHGLVVKADTILDKVDDSLIDGIFLPGGGLGVQNLGASSAVDELIRKMNKANKWILAICAAPVVLSKAQVLLDRSCTCFPGCEDILICREFLEDRVVIDRNIITSRAAGTAEEFAIKALSCIANEETAKKIQAQILAR